MRALLPAFLVFALNAQAPGPVSLPDLQNIQREMYQAPIGSLDSRVEQLWKAALTNPLHPDFVRAAQLAASYYQSQGYDLNAEQVLLQAIEASPREARDSLAAQLAAFYQNVQQFVKAAALREKGTDVAGLALLYENMGELEKAEAAWKKAAAVKPDSGTQPKGMIVSRLGPYPSEPSNVLADFYSRNGRDLDAEKLYKEALTSGSNRVSAAQQYILFLMGRQRNDEAIALYRQTIASLESSADPQAAQTLVYTRQSLAGLLSRTGHVDEAVALQKQAMNAASGPYRMEAAGSLANTLIQQNRLEEAERVVEQMAANNPWASEMLARIRDQQNKPEEAAQIRERFRTSQPPAPSRQMTLHDYVNPAQQAMMKGDVESAVAYIDRALAAAADRVKANPQELAVLISLAHQLQGRQKEAEAQRIVSETMRLLSEAPDHPRVAEALGSIIETLAAFGRTAEAERVLERQERILRSAKGSDSPALNSVSYGRIALLRRASDESAILEEQKRMLQRMSNATGPKSRLTLYAMREVAWSYARGNNWPEEEQIPSGPAMRRGPTRQHRILRQE